MAEFEFKLTEILRNSYNTEVYDVVFDKQYTLFEFLQQIIKERSHELGKIKRGSFWGGSKDLCEYYKGEIISITDLGEENKNRIVDKVDAFSSWGRTDYYVTLKRGRKENYDKL